MGSRVLSRIPTAATGWIVAFYVAIALALLSKGPPALLVIAAPLAAYHMLYRRPLPRDRKGHAWGAALLLAIVLPWPLYVLTHIPNALQLWWYESAGEMTGENVEKIRAWWFYVPIVAQLSLPWTALWIVGIVRRRRRRHGWFALAWLAALVVCFSLSGVKKAAYLLPAMPAMVLLTTQGAMTVLSLRRLARRKGGAVGGGRWTERAWAMQGAISLGLGVGVGILVLLRAIDRPYGALWQGVREIVIRGLQTAGPREALLAIASLAVGLRPLMRDTRRSGARQLLYLGVCYAILLFLFGSFYEARLDNARSPRLFVHEVELMARLPGHTLTRVGMQEAAAFYTSPSLTYNPRARFVLITVEDRGKRGIVMREDPKLFAQYIPGRNIVRVREIPVSTASERNRWRLYRAEVE